MDEPKIQCGECTACCTVMGVKELDKKANVRCTHQCDKGCSIYGQHPQSCKDFECLFVQGLFPDHEEFLRPDKLGVIFHLMKGTKFTGPDEALLSCLEVWPGAARADPAKTLIESLSEDRLILILERENRRFMGPPQEMLRVRAVIEEIKRRVPIPLLPAPKTS